MDVSFKVARYKLSRSVFIWRTVWRTLQQSSTFKRRCNSYCSQSKSDHRNVLKKTDTLVPRITNAVSILLFCCNQSMNANASLNLLILRRGKADKMCVGRFNALHLCLSHTSMLQKQSALGKDYLSPVKQLAEKWQKTGKAMTDRIDSVLCNKEEEISIELSSEKLESSMKLYAANAGDSFLEEGALNPKVEVLEITNTTLTDGSISSSSSSESYSAAMPDWKTLKSFKSSYLKHKHQNLKLSLTQSTSLLATVLM